MKIFRTYTEMEEGSDPTTPNLYIVQYDIHNDYDTSIYYSYSGSFQRIMSVGIDGGVEVAPVIAAESPVLFTEVTEVQVRRGSGLKGEVEVLRGGVYHPMLCAPRVIGDFLIYNFLKPESGRII